MAMQTDILGSGGRGFAHYDPLESWRVGPGQHSFRQIAARVIDALVAHWMWFGLLPFVLLVWWASDREPPLRILASPEMIRPAPVHAGDTAVFVSPVWRDHDRNCSADVSRYFIDSSGKKTQVEKGHVSAESIDQIELRMGAFLRVAVVMPLVSAPGEGVLLSDWLWQCNPAHAVWPISGSASWPVTILEATP